MVRKSHTKIKKIRDNTNKLKYLYSKGGMLMRHAEYDLAILGCGPAGLSAALYTVRSNIKTLVIGRNDSIKGWPFAARRLTVFRTIRFG
jgi:ribulose 1,5-bisphosphate synthetase/thiazole synthase